jgi:aminoglycoside 3-N-acetyltransferase
MERRMISFRELLTTFTSLGVASSTPVIVHASLPALGEISGGVDALLGALQTAWGTVILPTFTYRTMLIPEVGPADNALVYGSGKVSNSQAEFFRPDLPADRSMGVVAEGLRRSPEARRSSHPILSFAGVNADSYLNAQTIQEPLAPIRLLAGQGGWVILLGVDFTSNISIHHAERRAGRKQFTRWALTPQGVIECPHIPGCSNGFGALAPGLNGVTRRAQVGNGSIQAIPLVDLVETAYQWILSNPLALLCGQPDCERCQAVRAQVVRVPPVVA